MAETEPDIRPAPAIAADSVPDAEPTATALGRARAAIEQRRFEEALAGTRRLLAAEPNLRDALYMQAVALRHLNRVDEALATLARLEELHPTYARLFQERGHCHVFERRAPEAITAFRRAVELDPALPGSWRRLEQLYRMSGELAQSRIAGQHVAKLGSLAVEVVTARSMLAEGDLRGAEDLIRPYVARQPDDIEALRVLATVAHRNEFSKDAVILLERVLERAPTYHAARRDYAEALAAVHRHREAETQARLLMGAEPGNLAHRALLASILVAAGDTAHGIAAYDELLRDRPTDAGFHLSLGHALKTQGRRAEAERAYREAARLEPSFGDAYWSLANLKTYRFDDAEIETMRRQVEAPRTRPVDRHHLCFALGKALEDRGEYGESFRFYERGNALKKADSSYRPEAFERTVERQIEVCTPEFFAARRHWGCRSEAPIFIVGLPRAGSTLLEQILASHSQVEGTMELADIPRLVNSLDQHPGGTRYPRVLSSLTAADVEQFGEAYLRDTRHYRAEGRPRFVDKMPNNFRHVGLIHLILPHARIIDARREAMACCFSNFKQLFASGQPFTYGLEDIGRYYRAYLRLMDHWDAVLPGRVLRVHYEDVVDDLEGSVRRLLDGLGLPFEPACVEFHRTARRVHTASSEQVRRPINREGLDQWRHYEPWLAPLRTALRK